MLAVMIVAALGQTATDLDSPAVNRVAAKLKCSCGCNQNMACVMPPGCPVCKTNKTKIFGMQKSGMDDRQILDQYVAENGKDIIVIPPGRPVSRAPTSRSAWDWWWSCGPSAGTGTSLASRQQDRAAVRTSMRKPWRASRRIRPI